MTGVQTCALPILLLDGAGQVVLKVADWIGVLVMTPFRWAHPEINDHGSENLAPAGEIAPVSDSETAALRVRTDPDRRFRQSVKESLAWWRAWRTFAASVKSAECVKAVDGVPLPIQLPAPSPADSAPVIKMASPTGRQAMGVEPVFNLPSNWEPPRSELSVTDPVMPAPPVLGPPIGGLEMLTLVPTVTPIRTTAASIPSVSPDLWTEPVAVSSSDEEDMKLKVTEVTLPCPWVRLPCYGVPAADRIPRASLHHLWIRLHL